MKKLFLILGIAITVLIALSSIKIFAADTLQFRFSGISDDLLKNVQARLKDKADSLSSEPTEKEIKEFYRNSPQEISKALQPYGYFKPKIAKQRQFINQHWQLSYTIDPGPALRITQLEVHVTGEGSKNPAFQKLLANFPLEKNQQFSAEKYQQAIQALTELAAKKGFLRAAFKEKQIRINLINYTASILLNFDTGPRFLFGPVTFSKNPLQTAFLERFLNFQPGQYFDSVKLKQLQQDLGQSAYFKQVVVSPKIAEADENLQVPIDIHLRPRPAKHYNMGLGYGTDTGIRGSLGMELRRVTNTGQQFNADIQASQIEQSITASYLWPGQHPAQDWYQLNALTDERDDKLGKATTWQIYFDAVKLLRNGWLKGWQRTFRLAAVDERFALTNLPYQTATLLVPAFLLTKLEQDNPINPSRGTRINLTVQGTPAIGKQVGFLQALLSASAIRTYKSDNRLLLRGSVGHLEVNDLTRLPLSYQFAAGGSQSVRGYAYQAIGPGKDLLAGSVEFQRRIKGDFYAAVFLDAGTVGDSYWRNFQKSPGVGVVWLSPVGMMELTIAKAIDVPGKPNRIQFVMGTGLW